MRTILAIWIVMAVLAACGISSPALAADMEATIRALQLGLERQVERMTMARERANELITMTTMRSAAQLERSQEELQRQLEMLERFKEEFQERMRESQEAVERFKTDFPKLYADAFAQIDAQIRETQTLIARIDVLISQANAEPPRAATSSATTWTTTNSWQVPSTSGVASSPSTPDPTLSMDWIPDRFSTTTPVEEVPPSSPCTAPAPSQ